MVALALAVLAPTRGFAFVAGEPRALQLEVFINGAPANLIGSFTLLADGRMATRRAELVELGIKPPGSSGDELVRLDDIAGVAYRYDEPGQKIFFSLKDDRLIPKVYNLRGRSDEPLSRQTDFGGVLNYWLFASSANSSSSSLVGISGANATLDARLFGPLGTLSQSGILGTTTTRRLDELRLDTTWTYSNPETLQTYRAGDVISGGLAWTRPIRLAGLQMQRDFALRPDLVTMPLPTASGSAAVPSTLDVYVNNLKTYSQDVPAGPYQVTNIPALSAAGAAQIVVRDASGHETQTSLPFFTSPNLLRGGLYDFSVEAGAPRLNYGIESNDYLAAPVGSASLRAGLNDWLTAESHAEGSAKLLNAGLGAVVGIGSWGVLSFAGSGSRYGEATGIQGYLAFDTQIMGAYIHASSQRTFGNYTDLASISTPNFQNIATVPGASTLGVNWWSLITSLRPPRALDTISAGLPLAFDKSSISVGYVHLVPATGTASNLATLSYSRPLFNRATVNLTAFTDLSNRKNTGVFLGLSIPLDAPPSSPGPTTLSSSASRSGGGAYGIVEATKSLVPEPGNYGYDIRDSEGSIPNRYAAATYRSSYGQLGGDVQQTGHSVSGFLQAQGAISTMGGDVFLSNRIDDSFAVVDAGAPGVKVLSENRSAGVTDSQGLALIPTLRSYEKNKIAIDPLDLPLNAEVALTQDIVAPANRGGVLVSFGVKTNVRAAVVILKRADGQFIDAGANGRLEDAKETFVVGYDGRAYVKGLGPTNTVLVSNGASECRASFAYAPQGNGQVTIGPVVCQ